MAVNDIQNSSMFQIHHSKELGRHLVASKDLQPGEIIFKSSPLLVGPKTTKIDKGNFPCVGCLKCLNGKTYEQCPGCNWPCCSKNCTGLTDENFHGFECQILRMRPSDLIRTHFFDYFRFDVLIIIRALSLLKIDPRKWDVLMDLQDHLEIRGVANSPPFRLITEKVLHLQVNYLKPWKTREEATGEKILPPFLSDIAHRLYGILDTNSVSYDIDGCDAIVLYPQELSFIEHSCIPNTTEDIDKNDGFKMSLRAVKSIKQDEHISRCYLNSSMTLWGTHQRRKYLKEQRYVPCNCERCVDPSELKTNLSALKCLGMEQIQCGGIQLPERPLDDNTDLVCDKCKLNLPQKKLVEVVVYINKEVEKQLEKEKVEIEEMEEFLGKLLFFLHSNHYLVYLVKYRLVQIYGRAEMDDSKEKLHERLTMIEEMIDVTKKIDPEMARLGYYLVVLQNEQFTTKFKFLLKTFNVEEKQSSMFLIEEILNIVAESKKILKNLQQLSENGKQLYDTVCQNELKISNWIQENNIKI